MREDVFGNKGTQDTNLNARDPEPGLALASPKIHRQVHLLRSHLSTLSIIPHNSALTEEILFFFFFLNSEERFHCGPNLHSPARNLLSVILQVQTAPSGGVLLRSWPACPCRCMSASRCRTGGLPGLSTWQGIAKAVWFGKEGRGKKNKPSQVRYIMEML